MKYLTIDDVCEMLSISRRTLERMRAKTLATVIDQSFSSEPESIKDRLNRLDTNASGRVSFPEPDFYLGKSPRWEQEKLISWLQENGQNL